MDARDRCVLDENRNGTCPEEPAGRPWKTDEARLLLHLPDVARGSSRPLPTVQNGDVPARDCGMLRRFPLAVHVARCRVGESLVIVTGAADLWRTWALLG